MRIASYKICIVLLVALVCCACKQSANEHGASYYKAQQLFEAGRHKDAFELMLKVANNGDSEAQNNIGWAYENGVGVKQNMEKAKEWYLSSARLNNITAMNSLGAMCLKDSNSNKGCSDALYWLYKAAGLGNINSKQKIAYMFTSGKCVNKNVAKGKKLYKEVFESGLLSDCEIGEMLFWGHGVDADHQRAISMIENSNLCSEYYSGFTLGTAFAKGYGVPVDLEKAYKYYLTSAKRGNSSSQYNVGVFLYNGTGVTKNEDLAIVWIEKAAEKNLAKACTFLGYVYEIGDVVEKNESLAKQYYSRAASLGEENARLRLGNLK